MSLSESEDRGTHTSWQHVRDITNSSRLYAVSDHLLGLPFRLRIQDEKGKEKFFTIDSVERAVFGCVHSRLVRKVKKAQCVTVLCGDGKAISGTLCDRFRLRFRTNSMKSTFYAGFVHSEPGAICLTQILGRDANKDHSVGIPFDLPTGQVSRLKWIAEFDFVARSFCVCVSIEKRWVFVSKSDMPWKAVIPAFTLLNKDDEIEII